MANAIVEINLQLPGATGLTFDIYPYESDTPVAEDVSLTEETNRDGVYRGIVTSGLTGLHEVYVYSSGSYLASGYVSMTDTAAVHSVHGDPTTARLKTAIQQDGTVYRFTENALEMAPAGGGGSGTGVYPITVTVDDGTDPLNGARVAVYLNGIMAGEGMTDSNGEVILSLDAGTYTIAILLLGYSFNSVTFVVVDETTTLDPFSMIQVVPDGAVSPNHSTGSLTCYGKNGLGESGVEISLQVYSGPGTAGRSYDTEITKVTSGADGAWSYNAFLRGLTYQARRGVGKWVSFTVPNAASFSLPENLGKP